MDQSRRAVESYWRSRMVDGVTSDEDKVAPVYKLEEVCELLRTSPASIVKEVSDYILKRLDHKSPIVKQKVLGYMHSLFSPFVFEFSRSNSIFVLFDIYMILHGGMIDHSFSPSLLL